MTSDFPAIGTAHCIALEGADARPFAQAQFSGDVDALRPGHWQWNAWLDAQGRVRALMHLADPGDGRLLAVLRGGDAEAVRAALARYLFRLRVSLTIEPFIARIGEPLPEGVARREDDVIVLGQETRSLRLAALSVSASPDPDAQRLWHLEDIRRGWPTLPDGEPQFLPPALGLERLGAVAFDKGCYPGQKSPPASTTAADINGGFAGCADPCRCPSASFTMVPAPRSRGCSTVPTQEAVAKPWPCFGSRHRMKSACWGVFTQSSLRSMPNPV